MSKLDNLDLQLKTSNLLLRQLIRVTNKTRKTLTMVNIVNIVTLVVIAYFMFKGG